MENFQVFISKPCTENWNQMTPQEKGRFCDKCAKTVVDFSDKSPGEIKDYFLKNTGNKVCGRFRNDQLNNPISIQLYFPSSTNRNPIQIFYLSCLLAFGTTLFSCTSQKDERITNIELISEQPEDDSTRDGEPVLLGDVEYNPTAPILPNHQIHNPTKLPNDTSTLDTTINLSPVNIDFALTRAELRAVGGISWAIIEASEDLLPNDTSGIIQRTEENLPNESTIQESFDVFPNPADEYVNVKILLPGQANVKADLFDLNGKLIRTIIPSEQIDGAFEQQINIGDLPPATYLLRLVKGDKVETKRLIVM